MSLKRSLPFLSSSSIFKFKALSSSVLVAELSVVSVATEVVDGMLVLKLVRRGVGSISTAFLPFLVGVVDFGVGRPFWFDSGTSESSWVVSYVDDYLENDGRVKPAAAG